VCCSVRCRQARQRFARAVGRAEAAGYDRPLRLAYADPPYPGSAGLYRAHPDYGGEVDHARLIERLAAYDGWALSTSAGALPSALALCPQGVRVAAWHRGERPAPGRWPLHAWEPVIYFGGRQLSRNPDDPRRVDSIVCGVAALTTLPGRVPGTKPAAVCRWIFDLLGAPPGDTLDDLLPVSPKLRGLRVGISCLIRHASRPAAWGCSQENLGVSPRLPGCTLLCCGHAGAADGDARGQDQ